MSTDVCIICLQYKNKKLRPQSLKIFQDNTCDCDAVVHKLCILEWYNRKQKCPICHVPLQITTGIATNDEDVIDYLVANQIIVAAQQVNRIHISLQTFFEMRQDTRRLLIMYGIWGIFVLYILLIKYIPGEKLESILDINNDLWTHYYYY